MAPHITERVDGLRSKLKMPMSAFQRADVLNELAWLLRYDDKEETGALAGQALELSNANNYPRGIAYGKLNVAVNRFLVSSEGPVLEYLLDARDYFEKEADDEGGYSISLNFLALLFESYGDYETALGFAIKSLEEARRWNFTEARADTLSTLGLIYSRLCDFNMALESHRESLKIREEMKNHKAVASSLNLIARIYSLTGEYDKGLEYYSKSLALRESIHDHSGLPWTYLGMASLLEKKGDWENSLVMYNKALHSPGGLPEKRCELQCLLGAGRVYLRQNEGSKALGNLQKALSMAEETRAKPLVFEVHQALGELYEQTGKPDKALEHFKAYHTLEKEVYSAESQSRLKNQQVAFATRQTRQEAEIYRLRNVELKNALELIEQKNTEITDSIRYAQRIQTAMTIPDEQLDTILQEYFILYKPKDIVSGDFYWVRGLNGKVCIVAADCTGHGVPGGFLSMLGVSFLNEIITGSADLTAGEVLNRLRDMFVGSLHQVDMEGGSKDGMDIALCIYDEQKSELQYAGAFNPLYLIHNGELTEYKADRMPIAIHWNMDQPFTTHNIPVNKGDTVYLFSDGYTDQFGGPAGKKFMYKALKELLLSVQDQTPGEQRRILDNTFEEWKGNLDQVDDVLLIGVRFN